MFLLSLSVMIRQLFYILIFLLLSPVKTFSQTPELDSLKHEYKSSSNDSVKCFLLYFIVERDYNVEVWPKYNEILGEIALKNYKNGPLYNKRYYLFYYAMHLSNKGYLFMTKGSFGKSVEFYNRALIIHKAIGDTMGIATAYTNIGYSLRQQGNIVKAIDNYYEALKLQELIGDKRNISVSYNNIGYVHEMQGEYEKSLACYRKAEKIYNEIREKHGLAVCYGNMAELFYTNGDLENRGSPDYKREGLKKGIEYLNKAIKLQEELKDYSILAGSLNTLGGVLENYGDPFCNLPPQNCTELAEKKSMDLFTQALSIREQMHDTTGLAQSYYSLANSLLKRNKLNEAFVYANKSLVIGKNLGIPEKIMDATALLKIIYEKQGKYKDAVDMYELHVKMKDSLSNEQTRKSNLKKQFEAEYEIQASKDSLNNVSRIREEKLKHNAAITRQRTYTYGGFAGLILMLVITGVSFKAYKNKQRANIIITEQKLFVEKQKYLIEEKQKEIIDSIKYAQRIQRAHLPNEKYVAKKLNELKG